MQLHLALTVQPRQGGLRFYSATTRADGVPRVGDTLAVARYANTSPDSDPLTAQVTAVRWQDLAFETATVFLHTDEEAVSASTLLESHRWTDESFH